MQTFLSVCPHIFIYIAVNIIPYNAVRKVSLWVVNPASAGLCCDVTTCCIHPSTQSEAKTSWPPPGGSFQCKYSAIPWSLLQCHQCKMAAPIFRIFWLHFWRVGGSGDVSSIIVHSQWAEWLQSIPPHHSSVSSWDLPLPADYVLFSGRDLYLEDLFFVLYTDLRVSHFDFFKFSTSPSGSPNPFPQIRWVIEGGATTSHLATTSTCSCFLHMIENTTC